MPHIITRIGTVDQLSWQKELAKGFTEPKSLLEYLELDPAQYQQHIAARALFPMRVPRPFAQLMKKGDPDDPLLMQVLPQHAEFNDVAGYITDPLGENDAQAECGEQVIPGLLHKYRSRVLLIVKPGCAVNCRYCFRRHFPYQQHSPNKVQWLQAVEYIAAHPEINEVIFSGGDPLMADTKHLSWLSEQLVKIPHLTRLRLHTRLPVVIPQRIDEPFLRWLTELPLQTVMVLHINHANEVSEALAEMCKKLRHCGVVLLNQSVLLNGINNSVLALSALSERIFSVGILPYYLHLLDKTAGTAHFDLEQQLAVNLMAELRTTLPGFLVPRLVREIAGEPSKTPIAGV